MRVFEMHAGLTGELAMSEESLRLLTCPRRSAGEHVLRLRRPTTCLVDSGANWPRPWPRRAERWRHRGYRQSWFPRCSTTRRRGRG